MGWHLLFAKQSSISAVHRTFKIELALLYEQNGIIHVWESLYLRVLVTWALMAQSDRLFWNQVGIGAEAAGAWPNSQITSRMSFLSQGSSSVLQ